MIDGMKKAMHLINEHLKEELKEQID